MILSNAVCNTVCNASSISAKAMYALNGFGSHGAKHYIVRCAFF